MSEERPEFCKICGAPEPWCACKTDISKEMIVIPFGVLLDLLAAIRSDRDHIDILTREEHERMRTALVEHSAFWSTRGSAYFCIHCNASSESALAIEHADDCIIQTLKGGEE
ncbi:MAG: hypothetical protein ACYC36_06205 [Bellilinea sp.]